MLCYEDAVLAYPVEVCFSCRTDWPCRSHKKAWNEAAHRAVQEVHDG